MPDTPARRSLSQVVEELGKRAKGVQAREPLIAKAGPEAWLIERLVTTAGLERSTVEQMTSEQAVDAWTEFMLRERRP